MTCPKAWDPALQIKQTTYFESIINCRGDLVTITEAKIFLMSACEGNDASSAIFRRAIEALPDRARLDQLDPLSRALIETRLHQLVAVVSLGATAEYAP